MRISVLVVDDDRLVLDCVTEQLVHLGYLVHRAQSGEEAIARVRSHHIDVVITDYQMPNMNGVQLRDRISNGNGEIPIILMTGERDPDLRKGFDGFLQKPFTLNELHGEVEGVRISISS